MAFRIINDNDLQLMVSQARSDGFKQGNSQGYSVGHNSGEFFKQAEIFVKIQKFHEQVCNFFDINPSERPIGHTDLIDNLLSHCLEIINSEALKISKLKKSWDGLSTVDSIAEYEQQKVIIKKLENRNIDLEYKLRMKEQQNSMLTDQNKAFSKLIVELQDEADLAKNQGNKGVK